LFIEVPDAFSVAGVYRWGLEPSQNHLYIYSAPAMRSLLNKCGFEVLDLRRASFDIKIVAKKAAGQNPGLFHEYKSNYRNFLVVNWVNKALLKIVFKLNLAEKIIKNRFFRKISGRGA
jgi:hypothetical protein